MTRRQMFELASLAAAPAVRGAPRSAPPPEWMVGDAATGRVIESHWAAPGEAVAPGSVLKVVPALAHAVRHGGKFPEFVCRGATAGCWSPKPHGAIGIARAVAVSCNVYFSRLAAALSYDDVALTAAELGLDRPPAASPDAWMGGGPDPWLVAPSRLVTAYARLSARRHDPLASGIIEGLLQSGRSGTASALAGLAMAKTGTSPCSHARKSPGDGWVVAMWPPESPRRVAVMRACGEPGSKTAGRLRAILQKFA